MENAENIVVLDEGREETSIVGPDAACCWGSMPFYKFF